MPDITCLLVNACIDVCCRFSVGADVFALAKIKKQKTRCWAPGLRVRLDTLGNFGNQLWLHIRSRYLLLYDPQSRSCYLLGDGHTIELDLVRGLLSVISGCHVW